MKNVQMYNIQMGRAVISVMDRVNNIHARYPLMYN